MADGLTLPEMRIFLTALADKIRAIFIISSSEKRISKPVLFDFGMSLRRRGRDILSVVMVIFDESGCDL